jgi:hypothetical protein
MASDYPESHQRQHSAGATASVGIPRWRRVMRYLFAVMVPTLGILYIAGILRGTFYGERRLATTDAIIVFGIGAVLVVALWPEVLERLSKVKVGGVELEMLRRLDEKQQRQQKDLDDIRFVLTLLLPPSERKHLENLGTGNTLNYIGNHNLRTELRRLRTAQLIYSINPIQDIKDGNSVDLKDYVRLTDEGHGYLERIAQDE